MEYILHIGIAKTGSSSLQQALTDNRELLRRHGVVYPRTGIWGPKQFKQTGLFRVLQGIAPEQVGMTEDWVERFQSELIDADTCILSSEGISGFKNPEVFASLIPPDRTRVVMYVREPVALAVSQYRQKVKSQIMTRNLRDYAHTYRPPHFHIFAERWAKVYGRENIVIRLNDRDSGRWDIVTDFLNLIGLGELNDKMAIREYAMNPGIAGNL